MKCRIVEELLWRFGPGMVPEMLSLDERALPSSGSPEVEVRTRASWLLSSHAEVLASMLPEKVVSTLPTLSLSVKSRFNGLADGSGISTYVMSVRTDTPVAWDCCRAVLEIMTSTGMIVGNGHDRVRRGLMFSCAFQGKRLTLPEDLGDWYMEMDSLINTPNAKVEIDGVPECPSAALSKIRTRTMSSLKDGASPEMLAKEACRQASYWASKVCPG